MKISKEFTTEYLMDWLSSQKFEYFEWFNSGMERISLDELFKESIVYTNSLVNYFQFYSYDLNGYTYKIHPSWPAYIVRSSPKLKRPDENKLSYTVRKVSEVLNQ